MVKSSFLGLKRLLQYNKKYRGQVAWATLMSFLNKIFDIAPEILIGIAIDVVVSQEASIVSKLGIESPWHQILFLALVTFVIWAGESLFEYAYMLSWRDLAQRVQHDLRLDSYRHIQSLDLSYFEDQSTGQLVSIMNDDVNQLERFLDGGINQLVQTFTAVIGVGAIFFILSPLIACFAFLPVPVIIFGAFYFQKKATPLYAEIRDRVGDIASRLNNNISGIMTIKSFTSEAYEVDRLRIESEKYLESNRRAIRVSSAFIPIIRMAILTGFLVTLVLGAHKTFSGELGVGSYGVLVFLTQRLLWPLTGLATTIDLFERAMASAHRIFDLLQVPLVTVSGAVKDIKIKGELELVGVNFSYATGPQVLNDVSLKISAMKTTAFVGTTGSGKSTLLKLLMRFYEPQTGQIRLDGRDLREYDTSFLRSQIGLVSQDTFLFHGSVEENIAYGMPGATLQEIEKAAKLAEAHSFISQLSDGYQTIVGERGQKLSGGQRQRIAIARAILRNPQVLILDEATSSVDNETEAAIQRSMASLAQGRTMIVIAHRLSTIVNADQIFVLSHGRINEAGRHHDLLANKGEYFQLWNVQTGKDTQ